MGKQVAKGRGLSFFYNTTTTSVAAIPVNAQEAPFIFKLQTSDFQSITVQGQITFQITEPEKIAGLFNFNLAGNGKTHVSEDPLAVPDKVVRNVQSIVQHKVQSTSLRDSLTLSKELTTLINEKLISEGQLESLGITPLSVVIWNDSTNSRNFEGSGS